MYTCLIDAMFISQLSWNFVIRIIVKHWYIFVSFYHLYSLGDDKSCHTYLDKITQPNGIIDKGGSGFVTSCD